MAELPTPDDAARIVLDMCGQSHMQIGHALNLKAIWLQCQKRQSLTSEQLSGGFDRGVELGWFTKTDGGRLLLTEAGFKEM